MKVSCVCPTGDRQKFLPFAISCFLNQTYKDSELIILDDGKIRSEELVPFDSRVVYRYLPPRDPRTIIGEKRNLTNQLARGEIIVHWDDDDWSHPHRLADQVEFIERAGKPITGYLNMPFLREADHKCFIYQQKRVAIPYVVGGSLCYRRDWWEKNLFSAMQTGEDTMWTLQASVNGQVASNVNRGMVAARVHGNNTTVQDFSVPEWTPVMGQWRLDVERGLVEL